MGEDEQVVEIDGALAGEVAVGPGAAGDEVVVLCQRQEVVEVDGPVGVRVAGERGERHVAGRVEGRLVPRRNRGGQSSRSR